MNLIANYSVIDNKRFNQFTMNFIINKLYNIYIYILLKINHLLLQMENHDYILLIMNCKKYYKKAEYQKKTWLLNLPSYIKFYHVIGEEDLDCDYTFDHRENVLFVKTADDYNSLPKKVVAAYNALYNTFNFKYIYKTDDDQILVKPKFFDTLKGLIDQRSNIHYGGYIINVTKNHLSQYHKIHPELPANLPILQTKYCSGRFYFLSKEATECVIRKQEKIGKEYFEDYAVGYHLDETFKTNMLGITTNVIFRDIEESKI